LFKRLASFLVLIAAWLLWSGHFTIDAVLYGAHPMMIWYALGSCLAVMLITEMMKRASNETELHELGFRPFFYVPWLLWEIVKANIAVAKIVINPKLPISPRLIRVKASQKTELAQVIYANSITLTPGTVTMDIRDGMVLVHALTRASAEGVLSGVMDRKVAALERGQI